jgi:hypothetical protein
MILTTSKLTIDVHQAMFQENAKPRHKLEDICTHEVDNGWYSKQVMK